MDKEILMEIKNARKEAVDGLLKDIGFLDDDRNREKIKIKEEDKGHIIRIYRNIDKISEESAKDSKVDKMNLSRIVSNLNIIGRIREEKERKEQEYYRERIAKILENKDNLINKI